MKVFIEELRKGNVGTVRREVAEDPFQVVLQLDDGREFYVNSYRRASYSHREPGAIEIKVPNGVLEVVLNAANDVIVRNVTSLEISQRDKRQRK